jgi:hypothetical protein
MSPIKALRLDNTMFLNAIRTREVSLPDLYLYAYMEPLVQAKRKQLSLSNIAKEFNAKGYKPARGEEWTRENVRLLIKQVFNHGSWQNDSRDRQGSSHNPHQSKETQQ